MRAQFVVYLMLASALLAGCLGGDDMDPDGSGNTQAFTADTGAVRGTVFDVNLNPLQNARLTLVEVGEDAATSIVNASQGGAYTFPMVEPGDYRIQASHLCCHEEIRTVEVLAGQENSDVDFMLDIMTTTELQLPYRTGPLDWVGFIDCQFGNINVCQSNERRKGTTVDPGLETLTVGLEWEANGLLGASEFELQVINRVGNDEVIASMSGTPPFEMVLDDSVIEDQDLHFSQYQDSEWSVLFTVDSVDVELVYQQEFTIWWALHYWEPAPSGYSALPDR